MIGAWSRAASCSSTFASIGAAVARSEPFDAIGETTAISATRANAAPSGTIRGFRPFSPIENSPSSTENGRLTLVRFAPFYKVHGDVAAHVPWLMNKPGSEPYAKSRAPKRY